MLYRLVIRVSLVTYQRFHWIVITAMQLNSSNVIAQLELHYASITIL